MRKSSTSEPSRRIACARTPEPWRTMSSSVTAGTSRARLAAKRFFENERRTSSSPVGNAYFFASRQTPGKAATSAMSFAEKSAQR